MHDEIFILKIFMIFILSQLQIYYGTFSLIEINFACVQCFFTYNPSLQIIIICTNYIAKKYMFENIYVL